MVSTKQTPSQINSQKIIGHIKQHFMTTSPFTYVTNGIHNFVKCCIKSWVHLDLCPENMLFGGLQPTWNITVNSNGTMKKMCKKPCFRQMESFGYSSPAVFCKLHWRLSLQSGPLFPKSAAFVPEKFVKIMTYF